MTMDRAEIQTIVEDDSVDSSEKTDRIMDALTDRSMDAPTDQKTIKNLWLILVVGLVAALLISVFGVLIAVLDGKDTTSPDVLITMFTTTSAGLLGLFVKSPTS